jgi:hypothetical protein
MYAAIKNLLFSVTGNSVTKTVKAKKPGVKAAVSSLQKERIKLIDQMCASWGNDRNLRQRYFQLS